MKKTILLALFLIVAVYALHALASAVLSDGAGLLVGAVAVLYFASRS